MSRGRPFEPGNKFGRGRPPGSRNKKTLLLQQLLDDHAPRLMLKALLMASGGDVQLLRLFLERTLPRLQDAPINLGRLPMNTLEDLVRVHELLLKKVASGEVTATQARQIDSLIETRRHLIETQDFERRLRALEGLPHYGNSK